MLLVKIVVCKLRSETTQKMTQKVVELLDAAQNMNVV